MKLHAMQQNSTDSLHNQAIAGDIQPPFREAPPSDGVARRDLAGGGAAAGLSHPHISAEVEFSCGGSLVKVKVPCPLQMKRGIRGKVKAFSKASRNRLRQTCHRIRRDSLPIFVTLTYPGEFPTDAREWKRHLNNLHRGFDRVGRGRLGGIWKLEPQRRGAPHFHILLWGVKNLRRFRQWLALAWYRTVGSGDLRHLRAGTQAAEIRSHRGVIAYASKYMGKLIDGAGWENPGRFWGILNRDAIPWAEAVIAQVPAWFAHKLKRWLRRRTGYTYISHFGQTFYLDNPEAWFFRLDEQIALSP